MSVRRLSVAGRRCVGIGDLLVATGEQEELVTYALGSCLGVAMHDPVRRVGGLVHVLLPDSALDQEKASRRPGTFVDTGVELLLEWMLHEGAERHRLRVAVAGGATARRMGGDYFQVGDRNVRAFDRYAAARGLRVAAADVGGHDLARTLVLSVATGTLEVRSDGVSRTLLP